MKPIISGRAGRLTTNSRLCNSILDLNLQLAGTFSLSWEPPSSSLAGRPKRRSEWTWKTAIEVNLAFLLQAKTPEYDPTSFLASKGAHDEHAKQADWHLCELSHKLEQISTLNLHAYTQIIEYICILKALEGTGSADKESRHGHCTDIWSRRMLTWVHVMTMWQSRPRCRQCTGASFAQDMRFLNVFVGTCFEFFAKIQVFRSIISAYSNKADLPAKWPSRRKDLKYLSTIFNCLSTLVVVSLFASPYWRDFCLAKLCPRSQDLEVLFCCQLWCLTTWWLVHS